MLAIVIPYYKLTFFEETLDSLANQKDKRFKVYIGDDASPENPTGLIKKYESEINFIYKKFQNNIGRISLVKQWERCIGMIGDEEWIMILGDDDVLQNTVVESWYKNYNLFHKKTEVIRFASKIIIKNTPTVSNIYTHPIWESAISSFLRKFYHTTRSSLSEYIFSKASYKKFGFYEYPLAWMSDDRAWLDFSNNKPIFTINESIVFIRISDLSISGNVDNNSLKKIAVTEFYKFIILKKLKQVNKLQRFEILRKYENEINIRRGLTYYEWNFLLFYYIKYFEFYNVKKFIKRFLKTIILKNV
ncbi:glycosyltransferase family A protein [Lutibacter sp. B1]|uniref:glycosyltransferase family A protein n=1 Tax=Lutibacter sp. B1 TaxID=2725996 RepID=UPI0014564AC9|nr:glycosyltransferase family A protein [Lutibacter sp. B1]NLP58168.1 glycosyltransferase family 2 protein [Lutibacter sp. B1]